jgi:ethanolamine utilization microcompartment shell protein EutL
MEVAPAAYVWLAANEAEKAANITLVNYQPSGRYGRLYIAGSDSEVAVGREAAIQAIKGI